MLIPSLAELAHLAQEAGQLTLGFFRSQLQVEDKSGDAGIVTNADLASEKLIKAFIEERYPAHSILAEESGWRQVSHSQPPDTPVPVWIVDPLDGTTNFSRANSYYCISIGFGFLVSGRCEMRLGAVYHPPTGDLFLAEKNRGATRNGKAVSVAALSSLKRGSFCTGFSRNKNQDLRKVVDSIYALQNVSLGTRINGAAALDMALTASGIFHGFYEKALSPWDTAAGVLLMQEAGARVTNFHGDEFDCLRDEDLIAAVPAVHEDLLRILQPIFL